SGKYVITEIILKPELTISDETKKDKALRILQKAEEICLITRSIKTEVKMEPSIAIAALN
ncbi:MAG: OsmC family peroxiredoxin, partial [Aliifodinibius sp.]|nr:OsmC family peroxiredoxin [Fodinibius sp.]NIV13512.1 OsmC family peroxiredoxin [Fodinibius sp.]NIY27279.1 OsmC family peroxiredoxin [Fodinibius sp.]